MRSRGAQGNSNGVMPIGKGQRESLYDALCRVKDKRDDNRTFHIGGMLSIVVMASMSGANSVKAIARFAQRLDMPQRRELCMPHAKSKAGVVAKREYKVPSYVTIYNFLKTLDLDDFARRLTEWMSAQEGTIETGYHGKRDYAYCEDVRTRRGNGNIIGAMMLARTPAFVFMAKHGISNCQVFKENLQSNRALTLRMVVEVPPN